MLCFEFPPLGGGGSKVVYGLSKEIVKLGHQIDLVTMGYNNLPKFEQVNGVNVHRVACIRKEMALCTTFEMFTYVISAIPVVIKLARQHKYNINHTHFIFPDGLISFVIKKIIKLPYIITAHGSDVPGFNTDRFKLDHKILLPIWKKVVNNSDQIICLSDYLRDLVINKAPGTNPLILSNAIDLNEFKADKEKKNSILIVSRMFERKGIQYFLKALQGLNHNYEVNIVGDGPYLDSLKSLSNELSINVKFWGWLDNTSLELKELYETSSIFVFPSESENFPIVLLEAMAASMAIITTKNTGCAEVVGNTALLVEPRDPRGIREGLDRLMSNTDFCKELGQAARKRLGNNFTWSAVAHQYISLYEKYASGSQGIKNER